MAETPTQQIPATKEAHANRAVVMAVIVAALGYFVDIYDLVLFSVLRVDSLKSLGLTGDQLTHVGVSLLNDQMWGMLAGGVAWGVLGDRRGRISVLFGSITLYSIANILNGFVADVPAESGWHGLLASLGLQTAVGQYSACRFLAGLGLAGELGAGITLVSELLGKHARGYGTTIVASFGICGALLAVLIAKATDWRVSYFIGGGMGLVLLGLRIGVVESGIFKKVHAAGVHLGNPLMLLWPPRRLLRYAAVVLMALPIWFIVAIPVVFAPEIGKAMGIVDPITGAALVNAGTAVAWCYGGLAIGDLSSGLLSQWLRSRKKALALYQAVTAATFVASYFAIKANPDPQTYYLWSGIMGIGIGYWAVFVTVSAEQFGTNLRATAATSAPNFVRGSVPLVTTAWIWLKGTGEIASDGTTAGIGPVAAAAWVGLVTMAVAAIALACLRETYGTDLEFTEEV